MKRLIAIFLLLAMMVGALAACGNKGGETTPTTDAGANNVTPETPPTEEGDGWLDVWDTDPVFTPISNDTALDGIKGTGWFDSFKSNTSLFWSADKANFHSYSDGKLHLTASKKKVDGEVVSTAPTISRNISGSANYEVEMRFQVENFGSSTAFFVSFGANRAILYFMESKIRVGMESTNAGYIKAENVYVDVGHDWHTVKIVCHDEIFDLYMDGKLLGTFGTQKWGHGNKIGFFSEAINEFYPCKWHVEYVSYTVLEDSNLRIATPTAGAVVGTGATDVTVTATVGNKLSAANETVSFYLNDAYAGSTKVNEPTLTLKDLTPGAYTLYAKCGDSYSSERVFYVNREGVSTALKDPKYSSSSKLLGSYVLKFKLNGNGTLTAGDGYYPLDLSFTNGKLTYKTLTGEMELTTGNGDYIAVVDGGVAWLYCNGKLLASFRMPYAQCDTKTAVSGGVTGLTVEAYGATLFQKTFSGAVHEVVDIGYTTYNYVLEFEYTKGSDATVSLADGAYFMNIVFAADGAVKGMVAPHMTAFEEVVAQAKDGTHLYRLSVSSGIAQLFIDNLWVASWRLPRSVAENSLLVHGSGIGMLRITEIHDRFYYSGDRDDTDWDKYFPVAKKKASEVVNIVTPWGGDSRMLKVYSKDTKISATLKIGSSTTGCFYLAARYFNAEADSDSGEGIKPSGVIAGYDFDAKAFKMGSTWISLSAVGSKKITAGDSVVLTLTVIGNTATLYCNGEKIGEITTSLNGWGQAGYSNNLQNGGFFKSFSYEGDGNPLYDTATTMIYNYHTVGIFELGNKIVMVEGGGYVYESTDGGSNFTVTKKSSQLGYNAIVLKSGKILSLQRVVEAGTGLKYYVAYTSSNNGVSFEGPFPVMSDKNTYRFTMNGKVMQTSTGRVFFVSGECENENEDVGGLWVYYSDNEGRTWKKSGSEFNLRTTGENVQEGVIVELPNGVLRFYARNDRGFLVYSDSTDNGVTWDMNMKNSNFASVVSAFNVRTDLETGALWMCWEYNNVNDATVVQFPRTRLGLAVSFDGGETWDYVGDFDEANNIIFNQFDHWNIGVWPTSDAVFVTVGKRIGSWDNWYNYTVRISKDTVIPSARFNSIHCGYRDHAADSEGLMHTANGVLAISATAKRVYASGEYYDIDSVNGKRTMLTAEMIASFLHGSVTVSGNTATIKLGGAEYVFTAGSKTALINGEQKEMTFEALAANGTVQISIEDLDTLLGLTTKQASNGAIVITLDDAPTSIEAILAAVGIW